MESLKITIEMASSINGIIAENDGSEDFLYERNYQIMLELLKDYDCLVWGNTTFKNVVSWGDDYINDLKDILVIIFTHKKIESKYPNVIYCSSLEEFYKICHNKNIKNVFISGGAHINTFFMNNTKVDNIIINYNPVVLNQGINLFEGEFFLKKLKVDKIKKEEKDIIQIWYNVIN